MSSTTITPYLIFGGQCEEALKFYKQSIGAEIDFMMKFNESPEPMAPGALAPGFENKVMHASFRVYNNPIMASDGDGRGDKLGGFSLAVATDSSDEVSKIFHALSPQGQVIMAPGATFWSPCYTMFVDRFRVCWMAMVRQSETPQA